MAVAAGDTIRAGDLGRELDYDEITANTAEITAAADVGPQVTFTLTEQRIVRVTASAMIHSGTAGDTFLLSITDGSNSLQSYSGTRTCDVANNEKRVEFSVRFSLAAGSYTYKLRCACSVSAGTTTVHASATNPAWLQAVDLGAP